MRRSLSRLPAVLLLLAIESAMRPHVARAQVAASPQAPVGTLSVFLDCRDGCDTQYIRTEIAYVNWVRDRTVADVHVLVTSQDAGGGGDAFTLAFIGQRAYAGRGDTLTFTTNATTTSDEERQGVTRTLAWAWSSFWHEPLVRSHCVLRCAPTLRPTLRGPRRCRPAIPGRPGCSRST
jgi:hypothetical protein